MNNKLKGSQPDLRYRRPNEIDIPESISKASFIQQLTVIPQRIKQSHFQENTRHLMFMSIAFILFSTSAFANGNRHYFERGIAVTGLNDLCGAAVFSLPLPAGMPPTFHAATLGEYAPQEELPFPLSSNNCHEDIVVTTHTDPSFIAATGLPDVDTRLKNIPLREVPVISNPDGSRSALSTLNRVPGNALPPTKSNPNDAITLGGWLNARGLMHLRCKADGSARINLRFRNLIPNGVYSLWGLWNSTPPGSPRARLLPVPLGGIPNVLVPDSRGHATFTRNLASCPKDVTADGSVMLFIDLAYHSDNNVSGVFPQITATPTKFKTADGTVFSSPLITGAVTHDQVLFLISGEKL